MMTGVPCTQFIDDDDDDVYTTIGIHHMDTLCYPAGGINNFE